MLINPKPHRDVTRLLEQAIGWLVGGTAPDRTRERPEQWTRRDEPAGRVSPDGN